MNIEFTRVVTTTLIVSTLVSCSVKNREIDESEAIVTFNHAKFKENQGEYSFSRDLGGTAMSVSQYHSDDATAVFTVMTAGPQKLIPDNKSPEYWCEQIISDEEEETGDDSTDFALPWTVPLVVDADFGSVRYSQLLGGDRSCTCLSHSWKIAGGNAKEWGYRNLLIGFVCGKGPDHHSFANPTELTNAIDLRK